MCVCGGGGGLAHAIMIRKGLSGDTKLENEYFLFF